MGNKAARSRNNGIIDTPTKVFNAWSADEAAEVDDLILEGCVEISESYISDAQFHLMLDRLLCRKHKIKQLRLNDVKLEASQIDSLAQFLTSLNQLRHLELYGNNIGDGGAEALAQVFPSLNQLSHLQLSHNKIGEKGAEALAQALPSLNQLFLLDLCGNDLGEKGAVIVAQALPVQLSHLKLGGNKIGERGAEALSRTLPMLSHLELSRNNIGHRGAEALSRTLSTRLFHLELNGNNIGEKGAVALARALPSLNQLSHLELNDNNIGERGAEALAKILPSLKQLSHLELHRNGFGLRGADALARSIVIMKKLTELCGITLHEYADVMELPPEFAHKNNKAILSYICLRNSDETVMWKRVKMLLLGPGEAGKTTLVHRLISGEFNKDQFPTTHGVEMRDWQHNDITFSCWDLGGQETYLNTHPIFFTTRSIYVAVFNARANDDAKLDTYLRHILATSSPQDLPPVIVVGTRGNDVSGLSDGQLHRLRGIYPNIVGYHHIDSSNGSGLSALKHALEQLAISLPHVTEKVPRKYKHLKDSIQRQRDSQKFSVTQEVFVRLGIEVGLTKEQTMLAISLFHTWGIIHQLPVSAGGDVVLRPQNLSDMFRSVISARHIEYMLDHSAVDVIWQEFDARLRPQFLAMMHECSLAYALYNSDGAPLGRSLVPAMMSDNYELLNAAEDELHTRFFKDLPSSCIYPTIRIQYKNMPDRFFPMLHCRLHSMVALEGAWKHCLFLSSSVGSSSSYVVLREVHVATSLCYLEISSAGTEDMSCVSEVMRAMRSLCDESFCGMELADVSIWYENSQLMKLNDVLDDLESGCDVIEYQRGSTARKRNHNAPLLLMPFHPLRILFPQFDVKSSNDHKSCDDNVIGAEEGGNVTHEVDALYELPDRMRLLQLYYKILHESSAYTLVDCRVNLVRHLVMYAEEFLSLMQADHRLHALWVMVTNKDESSYYLVALSAMDHDNGLMVVRESIICMKFYRKFNASTHAADELLLSCLEKLAVELPLIGENCLKWVGACGVDAREYANEMLRIEESFFEKVYVGNNKYMSYSKQQLVQQRGMRSVDEVTAQILNTMNRIDDRTRRTERMLAAIDSRVQEVLRINQSQLTMLRSLLKGNYDMPQLLFAVKDHKWHADSLLYVHLRLFCVCPVTLRVAACGDEGKGWKLKVLRSEVAKLLPVLQVGTVMLQVAAKLGLGLNLIIPLPSLKNCRVLSDLVKQSSITISLLDESVGESLENMLAAIESGCDSSLPVEALMHLQRDYSVIHQLLGQSGAIDKNTGDLKKPGLKFTTSNCDGTSAFVHADGLQRFHEKGEAAFLTPIST